MNSVVVIAVVLVLSMLLLLLLIFRFMLDKKLRSILSKLERSDLYVYMSISFPLRDEQFFN